MHIPDGFVSMPVNAAGAAAAAAAVGLAAWRSSRAAAGGRNVPLLATTAAFVFAAQMLNFPIGGGTSGHFLGAVTAAALLGPWNACLVMAVVLTIQCLLFADGGLSALGANVLNMGVVGGLAGYAMLRTLRLLLPAGRGGFLASVAVASWASVVLAASACALELAASGTSPLRVALPAMAGTHAIIGVGEALIAAAVLSAVSAARPDVLPGWAEVNAVGAGSRKRVWVLAAAGLALAAALAVLGSPFASRAPDGLEKVAEGRGFSAAAAPANAGAWKWSPFPDYSIRGIRREGVSTGTAGLIGTVLVFGAGFAAIKLLSRGPARPEG